MPRIKHTTDSKLTPALHREIVRQLQRRAYIESWAKVAKRYSISRRNLIRHVAKIRAESLAK
jgi:hypothetical protein